MKKKQFLIPIFFLITIFGIFFNKNYFVKADVDYDINNVKVNAHVNKDGSLLIKRSIKYDFDSSAHGVYYRQNLESNQRLLNQKVTISDNNGKNISVKRGNEQNNTYQLTRDNQGYRFKVFHNINENDRVTVTYSYTITNAITNWRDTAELNFKIIGNGWDTDLDHADVKITFNNGQSVESLKAWAHGQSSGYINVNRKKGIVTLKDSDIPGDVGIEIHAIFPTSVTPLNKNIRDKNHKKAIISQEITLAKEANRKRQRRRFITQVLSIGFLILNVIATAFSGISFFKNKKFGTKPRKYSSLPHNYEIPDVNPVTAQILDNGNYPSVHAFTAYLTKFAGKNRVKIEKIKRKNYRIDLIDPTVKQESEFLKTIFDEVGNGTSFTTKELKKADLSDEFSDWQNEMFAQVEESNLINEEYENKYEKGCKYHRWAFIFSIILFVASFVFTNFAIWFPLVFLILGIFNAIIYVLFKKQNSIYSTQGAEETNKVRGFKKMLDDIGNFKMKDVGELIFWEDVMPYAVAFGLSKKVIKQLKVEFSSAELETVFPITSYYWYSGGFENSFNSSLESGVGLNSSTSGSSGGFSGGSSGGFGGGSGGGAF
ncbi:DUF2207 domain-containing protein [Lactobacillus hamsteri]|uniref:Integral membrane protein n=1 Tax=Lactobacillus hamsteri DSM 5661 = JCM 6256 TaxID=1423754 RepID=A0A0R1Y8U8_9LACO|nr:DUF2207 domain-containing protein [Lactobacillus hamsteri]KRM38862.1 hypothetical protein FC39_GL001205 [Lactobacillus hamsteri DSM 5661 = JCM 6256]